MATGSPRWVIASAWIATIALAFVAGRGSRQDPAPPPRAVEAPPVIGKSEISPAPPLPPTVVDVRPVRKNQALQALSGKQDFHKMLADLEAVTGELDEEKRGELLHHLASALVNFDPAVALQWARSLEVDEELREKLLVRILARWSNSHPYEATQALAGIDDPSTRLAAFHAMAKNIAMQGTERAVAWADSLSTPAEQEAAHAAIYDATPRGIGVTLNIRDGMAQIDNLLPNGAAAQSGQIRPGDRIVSVDPGVGAFQDLEGLPIGEVVDMIRGENGASLRLRILRETDTGPQTIEVPLTRSQVIIPERE